MKALYTFFAILMLPLTGINAERPGTYLEGLWLDDYSNTKIEIKSTRRGIKVKEYRGFFRKWRTYVYRRDGVFDDCNGRLIIKRGYDEIEWRQGYGKKSYLNRYDQYGYGRSSNRDYDYNNYNGRSQGRTYGRSQSKYSTRDRYCGDWYCDDQGYSLSVEPYGSGFRASFNNQWSYYEPYKGYYKDYRGNRYYIEDDYLIYRGVKNNRRLKFRKR
jgi:hypothetical protein